MSLENFQQRRVGSKRCVRPEQVSVAQENDPLVGLAELASRTDQRIQHDLKIESRPADDLQHVGRRVCCLRASASSRVRACTSSNRRTFSIAITA